jgi:hypothetical protein
MLAAHLFELLQPSVFSTGVRRYAVHFVVGNGALERAVPAEYGAKFAGSQTQGVTPKTILVLTPEAAYCLLVPVTRVNSLGHSYVEHRSSIR